MASKYPEILHSSLQLKAYDDIQIGSLEIYFTLIENIIFFSKFIFQSNS